MPSDARYISSYTCSIVTIVLSRHSNCSAISHRNPVFLQMTLMWPFKVSKGQTDNAIRFATHDLLLVFYSNNSAISHRNPVFQQMILIWPFKVTKGQTDYAIRFATYHFLYVFYSNYTISHGNPVFHQMTLIWLFKVTKGQTDYATRFATYHFLYVFYSNYSAISHENPVFQQMTSICPLSPNVKLIIRRLVDEKWSGILRSLSLWIISVIYVHIKLCPLIYI